jgi:glucose-1-phosphate thymidylyltransferase
MKGVILAGGLGTRLYPLTYITNKHLLPIYDRPMIYYPIKTLTDAGIDDILIVIGGPHAGDFVSLLRDRKKLGIKSLELIYQEKPDGGIADALVLAEEFANGDSVAAILGDNTTDANLRADVKLFTGGAHLFLKKVPDPERFGVPEFEDNKIKRIIEKPANPPSDYAVTGFYLYDNSVFDKIKKIKPSERGQLEITDVNNQYIDEGTMGWSELDGFWRDAGTFQTLFESNAYWQSKITGNVEWVVDFEGQSIRSKQADSLTKMLIGAIK